MLRQIGKQFKQPSGFLGKIISALMKRGNNFAYDLLIDMLAPNDDEHLFEIGYGHGKGIGKILSKHNCFISGIDFSELMYKEATKRNKNYIENKLVDLHFGDFLDFEFNGKSYDKIFCLNVVYFWKDLEKPFTKIRNGLSPNGFFYFFMAHQDDLNKLKFTKDDIFNKYSIDYVLEKLALCGFSKIDYHFEKGYFVKCIK